MSNGLQVAQWGRNEAILRTIIVKGTLPNLNDYTKACRSNKFAGAQMKSKSEAVIAKALGNQKFNGKVRLSFRWYEPNKKRDLDNICFAKKFILDALVSNGVIESDGWRGVEGFTDRFFVDKDNPRIEIDIEEVGA